jgi:hypothetical protein
MELLPTDENLNSPIQETFHDVEHLIFSVANRFSRTRGVPYEDALADAYEIFVVAWHNDKSTKDFSAWLWYKLHNGLLDKARKEAIHHKREAAIGEGDAELLDRGTFDLQAHLSELSPEARIATVIALEFLPALHKSRMSRRKPTTDRGDTLRKFLRYNLKWSAATVKRVWREIELSIAPRSAAGHL